jgi:transketolase
LEELENFRQWGSLTPGHPEYPLTPGVETTTGPLGQGFANGVGMAIVEAHLAEIFNRESFPVVGHHTYAIVTDGDLMEGVSSEAASLAGHLNLGKLIYFYDDNRISIDGSTSLAFTEDRGKRFEAYNWQVLYVTDGNSVDEIDHAIKEAKKDSRPSLIICRTHIGFGLPNKQDTAEAHGSPPGEEELRAAKENLKWPVEPKFFIPKEVLEHFRLAVPTGQAMEKEWSLRFNAYKEAFPKLAEELSRRIEGRLPDDWVDHLKCFPNDSKGMATRSASGKVINQIASKIPELIGGSADLTPSNNTWINDEASFQEKDRKGRNFHFGVREHAMGSIINGMAYHGGVIPYGGTFLVFSDYMRPALRLSAISHLRSIWVFTHDSIGLGEDGPTHQPIEQLASLRAIPGLCVIRPADANEVIEAWKIAITRTNKPTAIALTRQSVPTLDRETLASAKELTKGAYVLKDFGAGDPEIILIASGSEVHLVLDAAKTLAKDGVNCRVISFPSWELFEQQDMQYKNSVIPPTITRRLAVEAGSPLGWERWVGSEGKILGINRYGASAPGKLVMEKYGFTVENVIQQALSLLRSE